MTIKTRKNTFSGFIFGIFVHCVITYLGNFSNAPDRRLWRRGAWPFLPAWPRWSNGPCKQALLKEQDDLYKICPRSKKICRMISFINFICPHTLCEPILIIFQSISKSFESISMCLFSKVIPSKSISKWPMPIFQNNSKTF